MCPIFTRIVSRPQQGNAYAQGFLGDRYRRGEGVTQDYKQAVAWYTKSAEQGYVDAQFFLGDMYRKGEGVAQDYKQAVAWYTKSAEQGNAYAQYSLGFSYANGEGVAQNNELAYIWSHIAENNGNKNAAKSRKIFAKRLSQAQLARVQTTINECPKIEYKDCP